MNKTKLAVDFDSVLANTSATAFDLICGPDHDYTVDDVEDWTWGFREFGKEKYLSALWHAWTLRPEQVPPMEGGLEYKMKSLQDEFRVDIVTAHPDHMGITKGKRSWLDKRNIPYEEFVTVAPRISKTEMNYDAFIDDKPSLPEEAIMNQTVYLRDQSWNQEVSGDYIRVNSIADVWTKQKVEP